MNFRILFIVSTLLGVLTIATSCNRENLTNDNKDGWVINGDENVITLTVPAMPGFGNEAESRTIFDDNGTKPSVKWVVGDPIYIGYINTATADKTLLEVLIKNGQFSEFKCTKVNTDGTAIFTGTSIPDGADIAIYTKQPNKVMKWKQNVSNVSQLSIDSPCITTIPKGNGNLDHLAENDLLLARFNSSDNTFVEVDGVAFSRVFALGKFVMTFPAGTTGELGNFLSLKTTANPKAGAQLSMQGRILPYYNNTSGLSQVWGISSGNYEFQIDCRNLSIVNNTVTLYSLIGISNNTFKGKNLIFNMEVGGKTYTASITAADNISSTSAIVFNLDFKEQE